MKKENVGKATQLERFQCDWPYKESLENVSKKQSRVYRVAFNDNQRAVLLIFLTIEMQQPI